MSKKMLGCGALLVLGLIVGMWAVGMYNGLVSGDEKVNEAWAQVENVYQRRADLIPNLVETVKGSAGFEQTTLQNIVDARARVGQVSADSSILSDPAKFAQFEQAQGQLGSALSRLLVVVENYPDLKSTTAFRDLMSQLEGTENRITVERRRFNEVARDWNIQVKRFPTSLFIRLLGWSFKDKAYFSAQPGAEEAPKVDFNTGANR